ncbi:S41 family peptidase [Pararcticibacter amylolyticus]|nr:S41 family peptidase [Pararcticibacter amylolyticus]
MIRRRYRILVCGALLALGSSSQAQMNPKYKLEEALKLIRENYVDQVNEEHLVDEAIRAMISSLDPHSRYTSREEAEAMQQSMTGSFTGIGISFAMMNDSTFVTGVTNDGPAMKSGLQTGDRITKVDGKPIYGVNLKNQDVMKMLRGPSGSTVALEVERRGLTQPLNFKLTRARILDKSIKAAYMVDKEIGYISLSVFGESTRREMDAALKSLIGQGMKKLILDLQSNGGGYVQSAIGVVDEFLPKEKMVFYSVPNIGGKDYYYTGGFGQFYKGEMVVLIDESTASAAEITTGALQDWDRAVIVGRRSFGKGLMQKPVPLSDGSVMQLTGARYYTPSGRSIQRPYTKGNSEYFDDFQRRMASRELTEEGHVKFADSLKVFTLETKRPVYGGGGIMPDKFVPIDTNMYSNWMSRLMLSGIMTRVAFDYVQNNRADILKNYPQFNDFLGHFHISQRMYDDITALAVKHHVEMPAASNTAAYEAIGIELKAEIASSIYNGSDFILPVRNAANKSYLTAIDILRNKKLYDSLLNRTGKSKK